MEKNRTNAGFKIIKSIGIDNEEIVLGEKINGTTEYVTWYCPSENEYYFEHYCSDKYNALIDMYERALFEIRYHINQVKNYLKEHENNG